jgi:uncharacterized membrane protein YgcG
MKSSYSFSVSSAFAIGMTVSIAFILLASNFVIISAQQPQMPSQPSGTDNGRFATTTTTALRTFQSTNDSFRVQVPQDWTIDDINNTDSSLLEERRIGYGMLAQLCPEEEIQSTVPNVNGSGNTSDCLVSQNEVIHVIRYPDLETRIQPANNFTAYHLQKLQEVGYRSMQITNSTDMRVNLIMAQANQTLATLPAKFVEMTYTTGSSAPDETRRGYFLLTATNGTAPNFGVMKGYAVFYEGNSTTSTGGGDLNCEDITERNFAIDPNNDPHGFDGDNDGIGCETGAFGEVIEPETGGGGEDMGEDDDSDGGEDSCHPSYPDNCIPPPPPNLNCDDVDDTNFRVVGSDPHGFDGNDNDGIGCESGSSIPDDDDGGDDDGGGEGEGGEGGGGEGEGGEGGGGEGEGGEGGGGEGEGGDIDGA